jgi:hypothetical protein
MVAFLECPAGQRVRTNNQTVGVRATPEADSAQAISG